MKNNIAGDQPADEQTTIKFTNHKIKFKNNDAIFIFSDGLQDQFGGPERLQYGTKRIREQIMNNIHLSMSELSDLFNKDYEEWKAYPDHQGRSYKQIDDILLIGIKF